MARDGSKSCQGDHTRGRQLSELVKLRDHLRRAQGASSCFPSSMNSIVTPQFLKVRIIKVLPLIAQIIIPLFNCTDRLL